MKLIWKWKILQTVLHRQTLCFSSYKNRKLKAKLFWAGARERKKRAFFVPFILSGRFFSASAFCVLNTLSEYTYFCISKNITSYTFLLVFKIVEGLYLKMKSSIQLNKTSNFLCQSGWFIASNVSTNGSIFVKLFVVLAQNFSNAAKQFFVII